MYNLYLIINRLIFSLSALFAEKSELKWIQFQLNKYGYTAGKEDGVWGKATDKAFTLFMKDIGRSFNGKLRFKINLSTSLKPNEVEDIIKNHQSTEKYLNGNSIKKIIFVPKKIINIVC